MEGELFNQIQILVQQEETGKEFSDRVNVWLKEHEHRPILINATASQNGRQTLNFQYTQKRIKVTDKH